MYKGRARHGGKGDKSETNTVISFQEAVAALPHLLVVLQCWLLPQCWAGRARQMAFYAEWTHGMSL